MLVRIFRSLSVVWVMKTHINILFIKLIGFKETMADALLNSWPTFNRMILGFLVWISLETTMLSSTQVLKRQFKFGLFQLVREMMTLLQFIRELLHLSFRKWLIVKSLITPKIKNWTNLKKHVMMVLSMLKQKYVLQQQLSNNFPIGILSLSELDNWTYQSIQFKTI